MIKIENVEVVGWEHAIRGMRNPKNSHQNSDSYTCYSTGGCHCEEENYINDVCHGITLGENDHSLMMTLRNAGTDHRKFMRMITVYADVIAPLYWWKEFDTYKVGTVANSCSTMHKIHAKEFTMDDFSHEHLDDIRGYEPEVRDMAPTIEFEPHTDKITNYLLCPDDILNLTIKMLNRCRDLYLKTKDKKYWWQMIQLLPSSYNQKRTVMLNYEVMANIYKSRKDHKLDEWRDFCSWIETLPYSELITGQSTNDIPICHEIMSEAERRVIDKLNNVGLVNPIFPNEFKEVGRIADKGE